MIKYGIDWKDTPEASIELKCYRDPQYVWDLGGSTDAPVEHFKRAVQLLYPPPHMIWNDWTEEHAHIWVEERFSVVWGPAAAAKSNDFGCFAVVEFIAAPKETCIFVCSTTKSMLEKRIWESVKRYHGVHTGRIPGKLSKSRTAIINVDEQDTDDVKAGIHGIAVLQGTTQEATSNIIGVHLPYVRLIVDEMQATRRAAVEARANLSKGCQDFKFFGLANPSSLFDISGEYSEPLAGWDSIDVNTHKWKTRWGTTYHYDGFNSPAVLEEGGAERYPFLINRQQIDDQIRDSGDEDHPDVWTYCRGFPASASEFDHVLTESSISKFKMRETGTKWKHEPVVVAGLDPAFTSGGDSCVLSPAKVGISVEDILVVEFMEQHKIPIKATHEDPPEYQIMNEVKRYGKICGFSHEHLGIDETGTQSIGSIIDKEWGKCHKISFGSKPSELKLHSESNKVAKDYYSTKVTEMWMQMYEFGRFGHIRGLSNEMCKQFCMRKIERGHPIRIEKKIDMKERLHKSPDEADAATCALDVVRSVLRILAGNNSNNPIQKSRRLSKKQRQRIQSDIDSSFGTGVYGEDKASEEFDGSNYGDW